MGATSGDTGSAAIEDAAFQSSRCRDIASVSARERGTTSADDNRLI